MKLKIGTFYEDEAMTIAKILNANGIKAEARPSLNASWDREYVLEGRLSELKEKYGEFKDVIEEWERYLNVARKILERGEVSVKDFEESFLNEIFPERREEALGERVVEKLKDVAADKGVDLDNLSTGEKLAKIGELWDDIEKDEETKELFRKAVMQMAKEMSVVLPLHRILEENGIEYKGDLDNEVMSGSLPEDPFLSIPLPEIDEDKAEELGLKAKISVEIEKVCDVYADVLDAFFEAKRLRELYDDYPELADLLVVSMAIGNVIEHVAENKKASVDEVIEKMLEVKLDNLEITMSRDTAEGLLKTLEKGKIVKIKKNKVILCG